MKIIKICLFIKEISLKLCRFLLIIKKAMFQKVRVCFIVLQMVLQLKPLQDNTIQMILIVQILLSLLATIFAPFAILKLLMKIFVLCAKEVVLFKGKFGKIKKLGNVTVLLDIIIKILKSIVSVSSFLLIKIYCFFYNIYTKQNVLIIVKYVLKN